MGGSQREIRLSLIFFKENTPLETALPETHPLHHARLQCSHGGPAFPLVLLSPAAAVAAPCGKEAEGTDTPRRCRRVVLQALFFLSNMSEFPECSVAPQHRRRVVKAWP